MYTRMLCYLLDWNPGGNERQFGQLRAGLTRGITVPY